MEISPPREAVNKAIHLLENSSRPVIIVGHGARFHMNDIVLFAERLNAPVLTTFKGKGLIADNHPLGCGVLGRSGTPIASWFMNEADLLCVFGASFSNHTGITPKIPTIQVDFDPEALSKFHPVSAALWGEIGATVKLLYSAMEGKITTDQREEIAGKWKIWKEEKAKRLEDDRGKGVSSIAVFEAMNRNVPTNAVIAVDVGNNTYSFGRYFETSSNQSILMSGYLGSIGFGFPAAIGAWSAQADRPIFAVAGDGGFTQYLGEFTTAVKYAMPIKLILLNNSELGKISKEQRSGHFEVWKTSLNNPNYADYANNCGGYGIRVTKSGQLDSALQNAMQFNGPALVEIITDVGLI